MSTHWSCSGQMVKQNRSSNFTYFFLPIGYKLFHELFNVLFHSVINMIDVGFILRDICYILLSDSYG